LCGIDQQAGGTWLGVNQQFLKKLQQLHFDGIVTVSGFFRLNEG
jgi:hypothetical protein